ncbi:Folylpolyglutamate synthetase [Sorochytrium milnesiophthora]
MSSSLATSSAAAARSYADAIACLNTLQSTAATIAELRSQNKSINEQSEPEMRAFLRRIGYEPDAFNRLNLIHITGTKGKGSTAAFCESMLRHTPGHICTPHQPENSAAPIKTGLYTSPHLQEVRERIRINGKPLSQDLFARYFFDVWDRLEATKAPAAKGELDKPRYFRFLTLVALHTFTQEKTNATILEVGVGGQFDCTNVITRPVVTGITSLGMDHVAILGNTLASIASHKGGIMKRDVPCFTVPQKPEGLLGLLKRSEERQAPVCMVAPLSGDVELGLQGKHQRINAALGAAMVQYFLQATAQPSALTPVQPYALTKAAVASVTETFYDALVDQFMAVSAASAAAPQQTALPLYPVQLTEPMRRGLSKTFWPGRSHTVRAHGITWCMDGAHTTESINMCAEWFASSPAAPLRVLVFNLTHARNGRALLAPLAQLHTKRPFHHAVFCSNLTTIGTSSTGDLVNNNEASDDKLEQQQTLRQIWQSLTGATDSETSVRACIADAVQTVRDLSAAAGQDTQVLVTGSLYLVGGMMTVLQCEVV